MLETESFYNLPLLLDGRPPNRFGRIYRELQLIFSEKMRE